MRELWTSPYFGIAVSVLAFWAGEKLQKKLKSPFCNPLLFAILAIVLVLLAFDIPYESYNNGGAVINMFLAPATACLAVSIYTRIQILKENAIPILVGCTVGSLSSMGSVYVLCKLFGLDEAMTASLLPKSITTPIAVEVCQTHGGIGAGDRHRGDLHRHPGQHPGPVSDQAFPGKEPDYRRSGHWSLQPCSGHLESH